MFSIFYFFSNKINNFFPFEQFPPHPTPSPINEWFECLNRLSKYLFSPRKKFERLSGMEIWVRNATTTTAFSSKAVSNDWVLRCYDFKGGNQIGPRKFFAASCAAMKICNGKNTDCLLKSPMTRRISMLNFMTGVEYAFGNAIDAKISNLFHAYFIKTRRIRDRECRGSE